MPISTMPPLPPSMNMSSVEPTISTTTDSRDMSIASASRENKSSSYYDKGSNDLAIETSLIRAKLNKRRNLTRNSKKLVLVLVGLPGRGKSFIARKLLSFLTWRGNDCKVFNVGKYRRQASADDEKQDANFFDSNNKQATELREKIASFAMNDMLQWLDRVDDDENGNSPVTKESSTSLESATTYKTSTPCDHNKYNSSSNSKKDRIAIFDATNSTDARRKWILEQCKNGGNGKNQGRNNKIGIVFIESLCDDVDLLNENFYFKISNSPDYKDVDRQEAIVDLRKRVEKYEHQYETITDDQLSYIKIFNLSSKLLINHIYGRMSKVIVPALQAWNIGSRPVYLCRPGMTPDGVLTDCDDYWEFNNNSDHDDNSNINNSNNKHQCKKGSQLSSKGCIFRDALCNFIRNDNMATNNGKTSLSEGEGFFIGSNDSSNQQEQQMGSIITSTLSNDDDDDHLPFPLVIMTSTMPRAVQTASWGGSMSYPIDECSNLNPLDKGDYIGMELDEIQQQYPTWYSRIEADPFHTRFPGGESYEDLVQRIEPTIIDMEQQVAPVLVISHISVLQALISYFRFTRIEDCTSIKVPMNTVIKFTPERGGGWSESHHQLLSKSPSLQSTNSSVYSSSISDDNNKSSDNANTPIWGDHVCPFVYH